MTLVVFAFLMPAFQRRWNSALNSADALKTEVVTATFGADVFFRRVVVVLILGLRGIGAATETRFFGMGREQSSRSLRPKKSERKEIQAAGEVRCYFV